MAQSRVSCELKHSVPVAADHSYNPGDKVLVWRENVVNNRIGEWVGPFTVLGMEARKKIVYVEDNNIGNALPFNVVQVKLYITPEDASLSFFQEIYNGFVYLASSKEDECDIFFTEIVDSTDPRATCPEMTEAKRAEIRGLLERGTVKIILREEVPQDANILPGRFFWP